MKKNSAIVLYILLILAIAGGLLLFIFRGSILEVLRQKTGVDSSTKVTNISATVVTVASSSALDTNVLSLPRFTSLVNQVTSFNFDNICWRPNTITSQPIASKNVLPTAATTTGGEEAISLNCVQGNSLPFVVNKK